MRAKIICNKAFQKSRISDLMYGSFLEHMGRVIYSGIYEPGHPVSDEDGFRLDVIDAVHSMNISCIRYPGGNFVSNYDWKDGIGEKSNRPKRVELAWRSIETNEFGINEFMKWAKKAQTEPIITVNLGTKGIQNALELLEYCNIPYGSSLSDLRRSHGIEKPYGIKYWCLGNEMDGIWQVGHKSAEEYSSLAAQTGRAMKMLDPDISIIACGSSKSDMKTFPDWDMTVLDQMYEIIDYLSVHQYYGGQNKGSYEFLAQSIDFDNYINTIRSAIQITKQRKHSNHEVYISLDEWGVWAKPAFSVDQEVAENPWQIAPAISEQIYTMEDSLLFASMMISMLRNADIVKIGCQALLTNISACIMTDAGGECWKQTIYYPFESIAKHGRGIVLNTVSDCETYASNQMNEVPYIDSVEIYNEVKNELIIFAVNRSSEENIELQLALQDFGSIKEVHHQTLYSDDPKQTNYENHLAIVPVNRNEYIVEQTTCFLRLDKMSFNTIRILF